MYYKYVLVYMALWLCAYLGSKIKTLGLPYLGSAMLSNSI